MYVMLPHIITKFRSEYMISVEVELLDRVLGALCIDYQFQHIQRNNSGLIYLQVVYWDD